MTVKSNVVKSTGAALTAITCTYPLDASGAEVSSSPSLDGKLTPSNADQTGTYTIQGGLGASEVYGMFPTTALSGTGATIDVSSGIKAVGFKHALIDVGVSAGATSGAVNASLIAYNKTTFAQEFIITLSQDSSGAAFDANDDGVDAYFLGGMVSVNFNATGNAVTIGYTDTNGDPQIYNGGHTYSSSELLLVMVVTEQASVSASYAGQTVSVTLETAADKVGPTVESGATDKCGNTI